MVTFTYIYKGCTIAYAEMRRDGRPEPSRGPAPHHGQRPPRVREDLRQGHRQRPGRLGPEAKDLLLGAEDRQGRQPEEARRPARRRHARIQAQARPQARLLQDHGQDGRPGPVLRLRRRAAVQGHRRILPRPGPDHPRGLRPDRDLARHRPQHLREDSVRSGRPRHPRRSRSRSRPTARSWSRGPTS